MGFRQQIESYSLSKQVFDHIIKQEDKSMKSSSYACNVNSLSKFLSLNKIEFGMKNKIQSQLDMRNLIKPRNEKFN